MMALLDVGFVGVASCSSEHLRASSLPRRSGNAGIASSVPFFKTIGIAAGAPMRRGRTEELRLRGGPQPELAPHWRVLTPERQEILQ
jgi:hypothetical protein